MNFLYTIVLSLIIYTVLTIIIDTFNFIKYRIFDFLHSYVSDVVRYELQNIEQNKAE